MKSKQNQFDFDFIGKAVLFSLLSYTQNNFGNCRFDSFGSDQWAYAVSGNTMFIAIAGTNDRNDVCNELKFHPSKLDGVGLVHSGFMNGAKNVQKYTLGIVHHAVQNNLAVVICGHSYGGIVAQILAEIFIRQYNDYNISSISFGSPRGFSTFAKVIAKHIRCVIDDDPVPLTPFLFGFYRHRETQNLKIKTRGVYSFDDHEIKTYITQIERLKNEAS